MTIPAWAYFFLCAWAVLLSYALIRSLLYQRATNRIVRNAIGRHEDLLWKIRNEKVQR